jgi:hypothetical protein
MARVSAFLEALGRVVGGILDALWRALSSDPEDRPWERAAVRIVVPFAFVAAGVIAMLVAHRTDQPPGVAFENHLVFTGELFVLAFYGALLALVPLVHAIAGGELPIELSTRGARFAEGAAEESLAANRELLERVRSVEVDLAAQETRSEVDGREATRSLADFEDDLAGLRAQLGALERSVG